MKPTGWRDGRVWMGVATVAVALLIAPREGGAQVAWDAPLLVHPHAPSGWSIFLQEPYPGDDVAVAASWRTSPVPVGMGVRFGLGEGADGDLAVFGGLDVSGTLIEFTPEAQLDVVWVVGGGLSVADDVLLSFPAALIAGWRLETQDVAFLPYVGPRVVLDAWVGGREQGEGDDLQLEATVDLGVDVAFQGGWVVRFGATLLDREAIAIGLALPAPGR